MAHTKRTARKRTCGYLSPRIKEATLEACIPDAYEEWKKRREERQLQQESQEVEQEKCQEDLEEDPEEVEQYVSSDSAEVQHQRQQETAGKPLTATGGDPSGDPDDGGDDDDEESHAPPPPPQGIDAGRGWIVFSFVRDGGDTFFHRRLIRLLRDYYGAGQVGVEYHSYWWAHQRYSNFWRTQVHIRVSDSVVRAARERSIHFAIADRETQEAGIADAARQALYVYRDKLYPMIQHQAEKWYPRRKRGWAACTIASTAEVGNAQLVAQVVLTAVLNTELDAALEENSRLRERLNTAYSRIEVMEEHFMGAPAPRSPTYRAESPPRKRTYYGDAAGRTTVTP
ncbi:unnamed protein product [Urochloa humidicola]